MKKILVILILLIFLINFSLAQTVPKETDLNKSFGDFKEKTNSIVDKEIKLPEFWSNNISFFFKLESEKLTLRLAIILIGIWIFGVIIINSLLSITPFFEGHLKILEDLIDIPISFIGSIIVTSLISITGGLLLQRT